MDASSIGITPRYETVYRVLLQQYRWRPADLATALAWPVAHVHEAIDELRAEHLAVTSADDLEAVRAVEPRLALPALTVRRLRSPSGPMPIAVDVQRFIAEHECQVSPTQDELPGGHDSISVLVERLVALVKQEVVMLVPDYVPGNVEFSQQIAATVLRRTGMLRTVWSASFLHLPPVVAYTRWLSTRGATPRTLERVPVRVLIVDRSVAVVMDGGPQANVARTGPLLDSYCQLADRLWEGAVDMRSGRLQVPGLADKQRRETVLRLLADGLTDEAIARRIGVSVRTVRSEVAALMTKLNARSRFQAGLRAAQLGVT